MLSSIYKQNYFATRNQHVYQQPNDTHRKICDNCTFLYAYITKKLPTVELLQALTR